MALCRIVLGARVGEKEGKRGEKEEEEEVKGVKLSALLKRGRSRRFLAGIVTADARILAAAADAALLRDDATTSRRGTGVLHLDHVRACTRERARDRAGERERGRRKMHSAAAGEWSGGLRQGGEGEGEVGPGEEMRDGAGAGLRLGQLGRGIGRIGQREGEKGSRRWARPVAGCGPRGRRKMKKKNGFGLRIRDEI